MAPRYSDSEYKQRELQISLGKYKTGHEYEIAQAKLKGAHTGLETMLKSVAEKVRGLASIIGQEPRVKPEDLKFLNEKTVYEALTDQQISSDEIKRIIQYGKLIYDAYNAIESKQTGRPDHKTNVAKTELRIAGTLIQYLGAAALAIQDLEEFKKEYSKQPKAIEKLRESWQGYPNKLYIVPKVAKIFTQALEATANL